MTDTVNDNFTEDMSFEPEPVNPYDPQDSSGRRAMLLLAATFGGLFLLAWGVFVLYNGGTRDRGEVPFVSADDTEFKERPTDAGGAQTPGQDREVLNANGETVTVTERPRTEEPLDPIPDTMQVEVEPVTPVAATEPEPEPEPAPAEPAPAPAPVEPRPTPPKPAAAPPASTAGAVAGGASDWVVQVGAMRSDEEANGLWNRVSTRFSANMPSSAYSDIERADLGDKGIYYRVRVAGLADKSAANRLCEAFKARNQACFVKRR